MLQNKQIQHNLDNYTWLLGILPAFFFFLIFFIGGFFHALWGSFGNGIYEADDKGWAYSELLSLLMGKYLLITTSIAIIVSLLSGLIALTAALVLARWSYRWEWLQIIFKMPIGIPHLLAAYMLSNVFLQTGWYARLAFHMGLIKEFEQFPVLVHDNLGVGVILAYLWKEVPFLLLLLYPFVSKLFSEWTEMTKVLGATKRQMVRYVVIPLLLPLWVGGMWIVFAFTIAAYEIPALLARTSFGIIPVVAWQEYTQFGFERQPVAIAMNVVLAIISLIVGCILVYMQKRWYERGRRLW